MTSPWTAWPGQETELHAALVEEVRELVLAAATTAAGPDELRMARDAVAALRDRLGDGARSRIARAPFEAPREAWLAGTPFRVSALNPFGIPLEVRFDEGSATAELIADARHEGPPEHLHGGVSAWLMDTILGMLMQARGRRAVTGTLDVRYLQRTPLDVPLHLRSRIARTEGRKVWIEGAIEVDGIPTVTAEGLFIEIKPDQSVVDGAR